MSKAKYVDGFVLIVSKKNVAIYKKIARLAGKVWRDHGALEYRECVADDMNVECGITFPKLAKQKSGELVVFSWITYKSRKHRDQVNAKVMCDPRLMKMMSSSKMPFDWKRMTHGGFKILVDAN